MLASNLLPTFSRYHEMITVDIDEWDITNKEKGETFIKEHTPDAIINLAAISNVDGCEDIPEIAQKVNGDAPGIIAELCEKYRVSEYTRQRVEVLDLAITSTFGEEKHQQLGLSDFM